MTTDITLINQVCLLILAVFSVFMIAPSLGLCDKNTQYTVRNMTSGEFKLCKPVHPCKPGRAPKIPAGSDIGIYQRVGVDCPWCKTGTYSPGGTGPCKICGYTKCFAHQVIKGMCPDHNNNDSSSCMGKCEEGYIMNSQRSACELEKKSNTTGNATSNPTTPATMSNTTTTAIRSPTTLANISNPTTTPTSNPTTTSTSNPITTPIISNFTTKPTGNFSTKPTTNDTAIDSIQDSSISTGAIVGIIFAVLLSIGMIATVVYCIKGKGARGRHQQHSVRAYARQGENERFIQEDGSNPVNRALIIANERIYMENDCVQSSETLTVQRRQPQRVVNSRNCSMQQPGAIVLSFENMPYHVIVKLEETFETCAGVITWKDLAAWLGLNLHDVKRIENMDLKTRTVIDTWVAKTGNDVQKFGSILREKQVTGVADVIDAWIQSLSA